MPLIDPARRAARVARRRRFLAAVWPYLLAALVIGGLAYGGYYLYTTYNAPAESFETGWQLSA